MSDTVEVRFMNRVPVVSLISGLTSLFLLLVVFPFAATAQISFFQAPTFAGAGTVFVADFNGDGKADILMSNYAGGFLQLGNGDGTFKTGTQVNGTPLAVADFNGDGKPDILEQTTGTLVVLLGKGDGTFESPVNTSSGATLLVLTAFDVNGDGKPDVVAITASSLVVYLGKGDGTFGEPISTNLGAGQLTSLVALGDFNGDGKVDVAVSVLSFTTPGTGILLGNGDGTFQPVVFPSNLATFQTQSVADVNNDGKVDLIASSGQVALGNGDGTFNVLPATPCQGTGGTATCVLGAVADLNGDGKPDIVVYNQQNTLLAQIYLGSGDGTFTDFSNYLPQMILYNAMAPLSAGLAVGDFNSDGKPDIAFDDSVLIGNGDGTFQGIFAAPAPGSVTDVAAAGDFDKNGTIDVAMACGSSICIFSNDGKGNLSLIHTYLLQDGASAIVTADLNGDGKLDLLALGGDPTTNDWGYSVLLGNGDGSFQSPAFYAQSVAVSNPASLIIADFNNDGKPDFATAAPGQVAVALGNGDGTFAAPVYYYDAGYSAMVAADFNGDGKLDIAVGNTSSKAGTCLLFGNGDGTFMTATFPASLDIFAAAFTADVNGDGKADLMSYNEVALGNGDGTFNLLSTMTGAVAAIADLNGDGILDLLVNEGISRTGLSLDARLGNGDGTFGSDISVPTNGLAFLVADMNGDGKPDLVFPYIDVAVLLNTTQPGINLSASPTSHTIIAGQTASFTLTLAGTGALSGAVNLTCAITPAATPAPTCSLSNSLVQISGNGTQSVTVKVGTTAAVTTGSTLPRVCLPPWTPPLAWRLIVLSSGLLLLRSRKRFPVLTASSAALLLAACVACGGSGSSSTHTTPGTPSGTYTATVTATSGSATQKMALQVIVQ